MKKILFLLLALAGLTVAAQAQTRLAKSVKVPNFMRTDATGEKINLQALLKDNERVLICFFRPVWCPICNKRTHELIERYDELKAKGIEVVAIYPNNSEVMAQYVKDANIPFPVIGDPDEDLYRAFAIERSLKKYQAALARADAQMVITQGMELYKGKQYKPYTDSYDTIINADFLLKSNRVIEVAYYGDYLGDHYDLDKL